RGALRGAAGPGSGRDRGDDPGGPTEPQGDRDRQPRRAFARDRHPRARGPRGAPRQPRLPRAVRARRAGLDREPAAPRRARALRLVMAARVETLASDLPVVAIVGRPNVGKSALFNRIVRSRRAIVDDAPGVTRDRVAARAEHGGRAFLCVDTGGFAPETPRDAATLAARVRAQALAAIRDADCV